jgi:hypothetical protein
MDAVTQGNGQVLDHGRLTAIDNHIDDASGAVFPNAARLLWPGSVRRQNIWHSVRRKLTERGPRLGFGFRRRACGVASVDVRWSPMEKLQASTLTRSSAPHVRTQ